MTTETTLIEARTGCDRGSNAGNGWWKSVQKGLDIVEEDVERSRRIFALEGARPGGSGAVFTFWTDADGGRAEFYVCRVDVQAEPAEVLGYTDCYVRGRFVVLASATGLTYAKRMLGWWIAECEKRSAIAKQAKEDGRSTPRYTHAWRARLALHLTEYIKRRGVREPAPMAEG